MSAISASCDGTWRLWNLDTGSCERTVQGGEDGLVEIWDLSSKRRLASYYAESAVTSLTRMRGNQLACVTEDGRLHFLEIRGR